MRIIVEGADQQGKSTLCKILAEKLGWDIIHYGKPDEDFNFIDDYIIPDMTISDRNFLSEVVYSKVNGRKSRTSTTLMSNIFRSNGALLILLDREESFKFDYTRPEEYSDEKVNQAIQYYREEFKHVNMEKMRLNPNSEDFDIHVKAIIELASDSL